MQKVLRTKIRAQQDPWIISVSWGENISAKVNKEKNQYETSSWSKSARNKFNEQQSARNKLHERNQFHEEKKQYQSFTKRMINMQRFLQKNQQETSFRSQNQHVISCMNKIGFTRWKINLQVSQREKSWKKSTFFLVSRNFSELSSLASKNQHATSSMNTINTQKAPQKQQFHEEKSQCTSFT